MTYFFPSKRTIKYERIKLILFKAYLDIEEIDEVESIFLSVIAGLQQRY